MLFCLAFVGMAFSSCDKDDNSTLARTTWTNYYGADHDEGATIRFVSESVAYISDWEYEHGEYVEDVEQVNYSYNSPTGVFYKNGTAVSFTVSGNTLSAFGETFIKQ